jgi:catechol 2,3-dioxygenase-like lactoylglutathione lyase family enzyme
VADHGSTGPGHVCLVADAGRYDELRDRIAGAGIEITHDHGWSAGKRSFYFKDPADNLLEVADADLWPEPPG